MGAARERGAGGDRSAAALKADGRGSVRPLRWWKFILYLLPSTAALVLGWPGLALLAQLLWAGSAPAFDAGAALLGALRALLGACALLALVRDAGWDRRAPRPLLVAVLLFALVPVRQQPPVSDPEAALLRCGALLAGQLQRGAEVGLPPACRAEVLVDRRFRRHPIGIHEIADAQGPSRSVPAGVRNASLLVARGAGGKFGWISAVGADGRLVRDGQGIWTVGFVRSSGRGAQ